MALKKQKSETRKVSTDMAKIGCRGQPVEGVSIVLGGIVTA